MKISSNNHPLVGKIERSEGGGVRILLEQNLFTSGICEWRILGDITQNGNRRIGALYRTISAFLA